VFSTLPESAFLLGVYIRLLVPVFTSGWDVSPHLGLLLLFLEVNDHSLPVLDFNVSDLVDLLDLFLLLNGFLL